MEYLPNKYYMAQHSTLSPTPPLHLSNHLSSVPYGEVLGDALVLAAHLLRNIPLPRTHFPHTGWSFISEKPLIQTYKHYLLHGTTSIPQLALSVPHNDASASKLKETHIVPTIATHDGVGQWNSQSPQ